jgi:hypothetical protein
VDTAFWYQLRVENLADEDNVGAHLVAERLGDAALAGAADEAERSPGPPGPEAGPGSVPPPAPPPSSTAGAPSAAGRASAG